jgi:hypothetical protein
VRSKSASQSSPATGPATSDETGPVSIELEVSRQRTISWAVFGVVFGILLVWKLGTVGVWVGFVLIAVGLFRAYQLAMSFVNPPGTITVSDSEVSLPRGIHRKNPLKVPAKDVTAAYFLRRSVPWNRSAPVLVIEIGDRAYPYPRDWFASEADQRQIVHALLRNRPESKPDATVDVKSETPETAAQPATP